MNNETFKKLQEINDLNKDDCKNTELTEGGEVQTGEEKKEVVTEEATKEIG